MRISPGLLQAALSKLLAYCVLRPTQPPTSAGREMSSSLRATGRRPSVADWGGGISVVLHRGYNCPLSRAMDGRIMRRGIISSCQAAASSEIVKLCCSSLCKQRYSKYSDLYLYGLPLICLCSLKPSRGTVRDRQSQRQSRRCRGETG